MQNKDEENRTENKGVNLVTIVVCVFVVIFVAAGFASGGLIPAVMTVLVVMFVINSLKKQFQKVSSEDVGEEDGTQTEDEDKGNVFEAGVEAKTDAKSSDKPTIVWNSKSRGTVRMRGESFDHFMLRRFCLTKATSATTDAESEAKKADQAARADDLYDPDQYESVNEDLSETDPDVLTVNGRKTKFKQKKNPFEM